MSFVWAKTPSEPQKHFGHSLPRQEIHRTHDHSLDVLYTSPDTPDSIHDMLTTVATITIPDSFNVEDVDVGVTITHGWVRDLMITLERDSIYIRRVFSHRDTLWLPDSTWRWDTTWVNVSDTSVASALLLDLFPGDSIVNMTDTWFDDDAGTRIYDGLPPFTGAFRPLRSMDSLFTGHNAAGEWRLTVRDRFLRDEGVLESFRLEINGVVQLTGEVESSTCGLPIPGVSVVVQDTLTGDTAGVSITNNVGVYRFSRLSPGTYRAIFKAAGYDSLVVSPITIFAEQQTVADAVMSSAAGTCDVAYAGAPVAIPDLSSATASLPVTIDQSPVDVDVTVNITHTYVADLTVWLIHPSSDTIILFNPPAGIDIGDNITNCRFDDEADSSIADITAPFTGSYRPIEPLTAFDGLPVNGTWKLLVEDFAEGDAGTIQGFTLHFVFPTDAENPNAALPDGFALHPAYPNPFNPSTSIALDVAREQNIDLRVFDITGRLVETLYSGKLRAGSHRFIWSPMSAASGLYFVRAISPDAAKTMKVVLLK